MRARADATTVDAAGLVQGIGLSAIFGVTAVFAVARGGLSFLLARHHHRVSHLHPRPSLAAG